MRSSAAAFALVRLDGGPSVGRPTRAPRRARSRSWAAWVRCAIGAPCQFSDCGIVMRRLAHWEAAGHSSKAIGIVEYVELTHVSG